MSPGPTYQGAYGGVRIDPAWDPKLTGGLKGDLGLYRSAGRNFVTFMVGPEVSTLERERVGWFFHTLFGVAHGSVNS